MRLKTNGADLNYEEAGSGECLLMVHGFSDNLHMWSAQVSELSQRYRVLTIDARGHGKTTAPLDSLSVDFVIDDILELFASLGIDRASFLGYSYGGLISSHFALRYPNMVTGLILTNSGLLGERPTTLDTQTGERAWIVQRMRELAQSGDIDGLADHMTEFSLTPGTRDRNHSLFDRYRRIKLQNSPEPYKTLMSGSPLDLPDLSGLTCPVLIIAGEHDQFVPVDVKRRMHESVPDSRFVMLPTGHASALEAPDEFNEAVDAFMSVLV